MDNLVIPDTDGKCTRYFNEDRPDDEVQDESEVLAPPLVFEVNVFPKTPTTPYYIIYYISDLSLFLIYLLKMTS